MHVGVPVSGLSAFPQSRALTTSARHPKRRLLTHAADVKCTDHSHPDYRVRRASQNPGVAC